MNWFSNLKTKVKKLNFPHARYRNVGKIPVGTSKRPWTLVFGNNHEPLSTLISAVLPFASTQALKPPRLRRLSVALAGRCYLFSSIISTLPIVVGLTLSAHRLPISSSSLASCLVVALTSCRLLPPAQCRPFNEFQVPTSSFASFFMVTFTSCRPPTVAACCNVSIARFMSNYFPFLHA